MTQQEKSYSLWLRPTQAQIDDLTKIISGLAHRYRTNPFPPHITLLSSISSDLNTISKFCKQIIEERQTFDIRLEEISYTDAYFRNLFIITRLEKPLINLYEITKTKFRCNTSEIFMPHVSILYGTLDTKTQQALKKELDGNYPNKFSCQRLDIYNTTGKESEWHLIESYPLNSNAN